jgi:hypothetical protein
VTDLDAILATIIRRAPELRTAGVVTLTVDGVTLALREPDTAAPVADDPTPEPALIDDPDTYPTGKVPGFERPADLPRR